MGIWQEIKDQMWLSRCEREIAELAPLSTLWLKMFMKEFAPTFLSCRDMGCDAQEAVLTTCKYLLTNSELTLANTKHEFLKSYLDLVSDVSVSVMKKWPDSQVAADLLPLVETFYRTALGGELSLNVSGPIRQALADRERLTQLT